MRKQSKTNIIKTIIIIFSLAVLFSRLVYNIKINWDSSKIRSTEQGKTNNVKNIKTDSDIAKTENIDRIYGDGQSWKGTMIVYKFNNAKFTGNIVLKNDTFFKGIIFYFSYNDLGKCNGNGELKYINGNKYTGDVNSELEPEGQGTFEFYDNSRYVGSFKQGIREGNGTLYRANGGLWYKGEFKNDTFNGEGQYYDEEGKCIFKGSFKDGEYK